MSQTRTQTGILARSIHQALSSNGPLRCEVEEIEAFILGAKPAVLIFDWKEVDSRRLVELNEIPFRLKVVVAIEHELGNLNLLLANVDAIARRADEQSHFAKAVGWQAERPPEWNVTQTFSRGEPAIGFALGFPERAVMDFERYKRPFFQLPTKRFRSLGAINAFAFHLKKRLLAARAVDVWNPEGVPITTWLAFGRKPDPEEAVIIARAMAAYPRD